jgi:hypothetical protein
VLSSSPELAGRAATAGPLPCAGAHFCFEVGLLFFAARDRSILLVADSASRQWIRLLDFGEGVVGWGVSLFLRHLGSVTDVGGRCASALRSLAALPIVDTHSCSFFEPCVLPVAC